MPVARSAAIAGSATDSTVVSTTMISSAAQAAARIHQRRGWPGGSVAALRGQACSSVMAALSIGPSLWD
ncbi:hypothetical protein [Nocardiopsis coralliicola]